MISLSTPVSSGRTVPLTCVMESFAMFFGDFYIELYTVDSDEAMKRGDEAFNGSSLQFLRSV
jgi:hypothetical protein